MLAPRDATYAWHTATMKRGGPLVDARTGARGRVRREHATGRWRAQKPEEVSLERHGYDTARRAHEERLTRIFTPRPHNEFAKTKGNKPEYGNFSNYGAFMVRQTGKTF